MAQATDSISQAFFSENSAAMFELEGMVDRVGIRNVLYALARICDGKAEPLHRCGRTRLRHRSGIGGHGGLRASQKATRSDAGKTALIRWRVSDQTFQDKFKTERPANWTFLLNETQEQN
jgi:hypothetical protein